MRVWEQFRLVFRRAVVYVCVSMNEGMVVTGQFILVPQVEMMMLQQHLEKPHKLECL